MAREVRLAIARVGADERATDVAAAVDGERAPALDRRHAASTIRTFMPGMAR